jgi:hypothetical protein
MDYHLPSTLIFRLALGPVEKELDRSDVAALGASQEDPRHGLRHIFVDKLSESGRYRRGFRTPAGVAGPTTGNRSDRTQFPHGPLMRVVG